MAIRHGTGRGVRLGGNEKGANDTAAKFVTCTLESRLKVRPGHMVLAQSTAVDSKAGQVQTVILVGAHTEETGPKEGK